MIMSEIDWAKRAEELRKAFENSECEYSGCLEEEQDKNASDSV